MLIHFLVKPLECWQDILSDRAITKYHGASGFYECYDHAKALGNAVFATYWNGKRCFTSSNAKDTYKKYGKYKCFIRVYEIEKGKYFPVGI